MIKFWLVLFSIALFFLDLARMYNLVHRIPHGLDNLRELLEEHIHSQGLNALDKCSDSAINVCLSCVLNGFIAHHCFHIVGHMTYNK